MACEDIGDYQDVPAKFVAFVLALDPNGDCQQVKVGKTSPGPVLDTELLARFVFAPIHLSKDSDEINETLFADAFTIGASVNRLAAEWEQALPALHIRGEAQAERIRIGTGQRPPQPGRQYLGLVRFVTREVRAIGVDETPARVRVYDTSLADDPLHGDIIVHADKLSNPLKKALKVKLLQLARQSGLFLSAEAGGPDTRFGMKIHLLNI